MGATAVILPAFGRVKMLGQDLFDEGGAFSETADVLGGADVGSGADLSGLGLASLPIGASSGGGALSSNELASLEPSLTTIPGTGGYALVNNPNLTSTAALLATTAAGTAASIAQQSAAKQTLTQASVVPTSLISGVSNTALVVVGAIVLMLLASKGGKRR
jgi:hypothetical protein